MRDLEHHLNRFRRCSVTIAPRDPSSGARDTTCDRRFVRHLASVHAGSRHLHPPRIATIDSPADCGSSSKTTSADARTQYRDELASWDAAAGDGLLAGGLQRLAGPRRVLSSLAGRHQLGELRAHPLVDFLGL